MIQLLSKDVLIAQKFTFNFTIWKVQSSQFSLKNSMEKNYYFFVEKFAGKKWSIGTMAWWSGNSSTPLLHHSLTPVLYES